MMEPPEAHNQAKLLRRLFSNTSIRKPPTQDSMMCFKGEAKKQTIIGEHQVEADCPRMQRSIQDSIQDGQTGSGKKTGGTMEKTGTPRAIPFLAKTSQTDAQGGSLWVDAGDKAAQRRASKTLWERERKRPPPGPSAVLFAQATSHTADSLCKIAHVNIQCLCYEQQLRWQPWQKVVLPPPWLWAHILTRRSCATWSRQCYGDFGSKVVINTPTLVLESHTSRRAQVLTVTAVPTALPAAPNDRILRAAADLAKTTFGRSGSNSEAYQLLSCL
ncbi:expressed unknown protein [Seminavis robusta]|uniref:Uncharacterized protein n=1 Tax=Seminavis robusta TaxID=568900 RepID=A0A9N8DIZ3_9STRA|nr:expressed unknown protein [Seminavis robusta]|eukprot:Sro146_g067700.1 n/a (273) ;mRNA; r:94277-95351